MGIEINTARQGIANTQESGRHAQKHTGQNGTVFAGDQNRFWDPLGEKRKDAQKKAMRIVGNAFDTESKVDDAMEAKRSHIMQLEADSQKLNQEISHLDASKAELAKTYGIDPNSREQKDLELMEKSQDKKAVLTEEERARLKEIIKNPLTEYQTQSLQLDKVQKTLTQRLAANESMIRQDYGYMTGVTLARLKSAPMVDAKKEAEEIIEKAEAEITEALFTEGKDHVDEEMQKTKEEAAKKAEEQKKEEERKASAKEEPAVTTPMEEILVLDGIKTDVQKEMQNILSDSKLLPEDIKGAAVDETV